LYIIIIGYGRDTLGHPNVLSYKFMPFFHDIFVFSLTLGIADCCAG